MTIDQIRLLKGQRKLTMLTVYDYPTAKLLSSAGVDMLLVGDSLGMVVLGQKDTRGVTLDDIVRFSKAVMSGNQGSVVVADVPFQSMRNEKKILEDCLGLVKQTGVSAVKIEGNVSIVNELVKKGINVMGHTGLKPQTAQKYGLTGNKEDDAISIYNEALALEKAGAFAVVLECVPAALAAKITAALKVPTIGIGAGSECDGQVLVISDLIGLFDDFKPKFVRRYANVAEQIKQAVKMFKDDVESGKFPSEEETFF